MNEGKTEEDGTGVLVAWRARARRALRRSIHTLRQVTGAGVASALTHALLFPRVSLMLVLFWNEFGLALRRRPTTLLTSLLRESTIAP